MLPVNIFHAIACKHIREAPTSELKQDAFGGRHTVRGFTLTDDKLPIWVEPSFIAAADLWDAVAMQRAIALAMQRTTEVVLAEG